jgi:hypothetical protein
LEILFPELCGRSCFLNSAAEGLNAVGRAAIRRASNVGGFGSGRHGTRTTVEACLLLSADRLMHLKLFDQTGHHWGLLRWQTASTGETIAVAQYKMDALSDALLLRYTITRSLEPVQYPVRLTSTITPWRSVRWWFSCPLVRGRGICGRRVGKLYLPPLCKYFGRRNCHKLTYASCNERVHKYDSLSKDLFLSLGLCSAFDSRREAASYVQRFGRVLDELHCPSPG